MGSSPIIAQEEECELPNRRYQSHTPRSPPESRLGWPSQLSSGTPSESVLMSLFAPRAIFTHPAAIIASGVAFPTIERKGL